MSTQTMRGPAALIDVFLTKGLHPDGMGEVFNLSSEAARAIRECGYTARAGRCGRVWRCPPLPDELVRGTYFHYLSDAIVRRYGYGPGEWHPKRASFRPIARIDPVSRHEWQILGLLGKNHRLTRTQLLRRISRWATAAYLNRMLASLARLNRITIDVGWIYPYSSAELEAIRRRERERRLTPIRPS